MINYDYIQYIKYIDYNCIKGFQYERYVVKKLRDFFDIAEIYLWKDVPDYLLIDSGIILSNDLVNVKDKYKTSDVYRNYNVLLDTGIDIIFKLNSGEIYLVQCKAYNSIISQKHLSGFFRTILDCYVITNNKSGKSDKSANIKGLIVHTSSISGLIKESYCYKEKLVNELYIPFNSKSPKNKLLKYKKISLIFMINFNCILIYILYIIQLYINKT
jgi:predicted helicase